MLVVGFVRVTESGVTATHLLEGLSGDRDESRVLSRVDVSRLGTPDTLRATVKDEP